MLSNRELHKKTEKSATKVNQQGKPSDTPTHPGGVREPQQQQASLEKQEQHYSQQLFARQLISYKAHGIVIYLRSVNISLPFTSQCFVAVGSWGATVGMNSTPLGLQSRFGDNPLKSQPVCPQNGTAVPKGLTILGRLDIDQNNDTSIINE